MDRRLINPSSVVEGQVKTIIISSVSFGAGALIYILFRSKNLLMFNWIDKIGLMNLVSSIRPNLKDVPEWVLFSLPDGLWMFSYCLLIGHIWNYNLKRSSFFLALLPIYAISNEIMQYFHFVPGTFDWMDLIAFLVSFALGLCYIIWQMSPLNNRINV